ncbi:17598_t:CDS:1, partial [Funneliformis caledonium]
LLEPPELSEPSEPLESSGLSTPSRPLESLECSTSMMSFRRKSVELLSRKSTDSMMNDDNSLLYNIRDDDPDSLP